jgi:hypothetical protein
VDVSVIQRKDFQLDLFSGLPMLLVGRFFASNRSTENLSGLVIL